MPSLRDGTIAVVAAITLLASTQADAQSSAMIRATCTQKGITVYREDIPADASAERRLSIASKNPQAMCVFLKISDLPPEHRSPATTGELPDEVIRGAIKGGGMADESLAAALSVLSGDTGSPAASGIEESFSNGFDQPMARGSLPEDRQRPLNLTIGLYRSVPMESVVAHWKTMQAGTKVLSRMTPSMSVVGDVTMLSVENVQDEDAAELCREAEEKGVGCIAVY